MFTLCVQPASKEKASSKKDRSLPRRPHVPTEAKMRKLRKQFKLMLNKVRTDSISLDIVKEACLLSLVMYTPLAVSILRRQA